MNISQEIEVWESLVPLGGSTCIILICRGVNGTCVGGRETSPQGDLEGLEGPTFTLLLRIKFLVCGF